MPKGVRSARGELVDFDMLRIKENLGATPKASTVKAREDFIDNKFKRRMRRLSETVAAQAASKTAAPVATDDETLPVSEVDEQVEDVSADTEQEVQPVAVVPPKKKIIKTTE